MVGKQGQDTMNFTQLALDIIEIEFGPHDRFDAVTIMRKVNKRWGLRTDWHDFTFPLESLMNENRIKHYRPGAYPGIAQYRRVIAKET